MVIFAGIQPWPPRSRCDWNQSCPCPWRTWCRTSVENDHLPLVTGIQSGEFIQVQWQKVGFSWRFSSKKTGVFHINNSDYKSDYHWLKSPELWSTAAQNWGCEQPSRGPGKNLRSWGEILKSCQFGHRHNISASAIILMLVSEQLVSSPSTAAVVRKIYSQFSAVPTTWGHSKKSEVSLSLKKSLASQRG